MAAEATAAAANVSWFTVVASSALTSAAVNVGWNAFSKWLDRRREKAKEKQRVGHVKLEIMDQLESFANRCANYMYEIHEGFDEYYRHEPEAFSRVQHDIPLKFHPEPQWAELPVPFVAPLKALVREYSDTGAWIARTGLWADIPEQYEFELERLAFYGLEVLGVAGKIRKEIKAGERGTVQLEGSRKEFNKLIQQRREGYKKSACDITFIPELEALFEREMPDLKAQQLRARKAEELLQAEELRSASQKSGQ
ncbi:hypothetical protein G3N95_14740 [Paraburkholderia sp. Tr-20389]|uniref:hypothetical protein n=1 Tax=Paraburkholderia sp. Tr-20389 TaxID=2703903 RepID=UPI00197EA4B7|nr:hypothetical protein [Paraburkholderia sp. Tr-20389]MBN3754206.1 hypothetical protein [Paraburkholderia sp. Tr-20389]